MMNTHAGLININKPAGISSFGVVRQVRRILGVKKAGHCGTLDPMAEGVLLVLYGRATKLQDAFMQGRKTYRAAFLLGTTTDTGDTTGTVTGTLPVPELTDALVQQAVERFTGVIEQVPPMYSALKYGGRKLYDLAREGLTVERAPRTVTVYAIEVLSYGGTQLELRVECSRGTYIRTLGEDIGRVLGCGATMSALCREKVGEFSVTTAVDGARLGEYSGAGLLEKAFPVEVLEEMAGRKAGGSL